MEKSQEQKGADQLIVELDNMYKKIAGDYRKVGTKDPIFDVITNDAVMESVIKLTNIVDKIKKIGSSGEETTEDNTEKVRDLQTWTLNKKRKA